MSARIIISVGNFLNYYLTAFYISNAMNERKKLTPNTRNERLKECDQ